jgi:hypothetical protein
MTCTSVQGKATMGHDILKGILRQAVHCAGVASTLKPSLCQLAGLEACAHNGAAGTVATGLEAQQNIMLASETGMSILDVTIAHPVGVANLVDAGLTNGTAVAWQDKERRRAYDRLEPYRSPFIPLSVETYGRLGKPAFSFLSQLVVGAEEAGRKVRKFCSVMAVI